MKQIINSLYSLSEIGICHRDLKFDNILIKGDLLKICDFGSAK